MNAIPPIQSFEEFEAEAVKVMAPPPYASKFGAVPWKSMTASGPSYEWLVKGLITQGELAMLAGASGSGKSFLTIDLAMAVARGVSWFGRPVARGGVVYQAGEGATGLRRKRIPAYCRENVIQDEDDIPFVLLPNKVNLWDGAANTEDLIKEIQHWAAQMSHPLRLVVIDTLAKAMTGGDEISGKDMGQVLDRCDMIRRATGAAVLLVHHMNAGGEKVRGHTSIQGNLESVLLCRMAATPGTRGQSGAPIVDVDNRKVRELLVGKAKEDESDVKPFRFVLRSVEIDRDEDGDAITSCIVTPPSGDEMVPVDGAKKPGLGPNLTLAFRALVQALERHGRLAPGHVRDAGNAQCVTLADWRDEYERLAAGEDEDPAKLKERVKKARDRACGELINRHYIRKDGDWVWRTNRRASGVDRVQPPPSEPLPTASQDDQDQDFIF